MSEPSALRVLLVTKGLDIGGIERMVVDLANALARHGAREMVSARTNLDGSLVSAARYRIIARCRRIANFAEVFRAEVGRRAVASLRSMS